LIEITRRLALELRAVFSRALKMPSKGFPHAITLQAGRDGLRVWARSGFVAMEYHATGRRHPPEEIVLPWEFPADCEASIPPYYILCLREGSG